MKKLIASAMIAASMGITALAADTKTNVSGETAANTANSVNAPQIRVRVGNGRRFQQRRVRVVTRTRTNGRFRETIRTTYYPNGRVITRIVSRVRYR